MSDEGSRIGSTDEKDEAGEAGSSSGLNMIAEVANAREDKPLIKHGVKISQVDVEEVKMQVANWSLAVICMVLGENPPMPVFEGFIKRIWGHLRIARIIKMAMGLKIVKFNDEATRDQVLEVFCNLTGSLSLDANRVAHSTTLREIAAWTPTETGALKLNVDASVRKGFERSCLGCVARDSASRVTFAIASTLQ
uniref:DUF4283 domain-containing protein n=1 Tax=Cannabis sativa TaxID=3483 RepID=A0A803Q770_CANSA